MSPLARHNVCVLGQPDAAETMLFAHGFGTDQTIWHVVASAFADRYRLVLYDSAGATPHTEACFNPQRHARLHGFSDDLLDIMEELSLRKVIFVGHSAGGMVGVLAALQEPGWFERLVLIGASPRYQNEPGYEGGFSADALTQLFTQMSRSFHSWASGFAPAAMRNPDRPDLAAQFARSLLAMRPDVALAIARTIFLSDHRADVARLTHPTLLLQGHADIAVPEAVGHYLQQHMPNAQLAFVPAEGHYPHLSAPDAVIAAIRRFLR